MTSVNAYAGFKYDTPMALDRIARIMDVMIRMGTATAEQIAQATEIDKRAVARYVYHLRETGRMVLLTPHNVGGGIPALYGVAEGLAADLEPEFIRRTVGANDWPRGEHAHRSGLLAAFFPFAQE
jgi:hypothetical protein